MSEESKRDIEASLSDIIAEAETDIAIANTQLRSIESSRTSISDQTNRLSNMTSYQLFGGNVVINTTPETSVTQEVLLTNEARSKLDGDAKMKLLDRIKSVQQPLYEMLSVSINNPDRLTNTHSLANLLTENEVNFRQYDLLRPYEIVYPTTGSALEMDGNAPKTHNLFVDYMNITAQNVANSSRWYRQFLPITTNIQEDLNWTLAYYKKNTAPDLYQKVYKRMVTYDRATHGGPLFLKILLDLVTTTGEANLRALKEIVNSYSIKTMCPGEDIQKVTDQLQTVYRNIDALTKGKLPDDAALRLLRIMQTTSVPTFNTTFAGQETELTQQEIHRSINPDYKSNGVEYKNELDTILHILMFADNLFIRLKQDGTWDKCLQRPPGQSTFVAVDANSPKANPPPFTWTTRCFNCGQDHKLNDCPFARDEQRIKTNRYKHPSNERYRLRLKKFKPPLEHENGCRVIDGKPHKWNPTGGRNKKGRWIPEGPGDDDTKTATQVHAQHKQNDDKTTTTTETYPSHINTDEFNDIASTLGMTTLTEDPTELKIQLYTLQKRFNEALTKL